MYGAILGDIIGSPYMPCFIDIHGSGFIFEGYVQMINEILRDGVKIYVQKGYRLRKGEGNI